MRLCCEANLKGLFTLYIFCEAINGIGQKLAAFDLAKRLVDAKGIINLGALGSNISPYSSTIANDPSVRLNVDLFPDSLPQFRQLDLNDLLPFSDKEFDVAFASHILEHLDNPPAALAEWRRIANHVVIVLPHPWSLTNYLAPDHKYFFNFRDIDSLRTLENVHVFC